MNVFSIKDLENLSGIKAHTIRIWEQRYSFLKPQRTETNIRHYSNAELQTLLNISLLNKYGFKISHIDKLSEQEIKQKVLGLNNQQAQQERVINELIKYLVEFSLEKLEAELENYIAAKGVEKAIIQIIFPFLERIGILWQTNHIIPAQEHLVTNIIRQKIIVGIDNVASPIQRNKVALLFLPEGEYHELGLLFINFILKERGFKIIYVGANVPLRDIEYLAKLKQPHFIYTHITSVMGNFRFDHFLNQLHQQLANFSIIISGYHTINYKKKIPENISLCKSLSEVMHFIGSM